MITTEQPGKALKPEPSRKIEWIVLAFNLYVSICVGILLAVVRYYSLSYLKVVSDLNTLPALSRLLLYLPSRDYYAGHYIFIMVCLIPCLYLTERIVKRKPHVVVEGLMVAVGVIISGAVMGVIMAFPCFPRILELTDSGSLSSVGLAIVVTFGLLIAVTIFRTLRNSRRR